MLFKKVLLHIVLGDDDDDDDDERDATKLRLAVDVVRKSGTPPHDDGCLVKSSTPTRRTTSQ